MAMIPLRDYALNHGKTERAYHELARNGRFKTAKKLGKLWLIDENEPPPVDARVTSGKYRHWRKKRPCDGCHDDR